VLERSPTTGASRGPKGRSAVTTLGRHLLDTADLDREQIGLIMERASEMQEVLRRSKKRLPVLEGRTVCTAFWESSTRTRHNSGSATSSPCTRDRTADSNPPPPIAVVSS